MASSSSMSAFGVVPEPLATLVEDLHRSGAISDTERDALVSLVGREVIRDLFAAAARNRASPVPHPASFQTQEYTMNPKSVINSIERSRAVMEAQLQKMNEFAPTPPRVLLAAEETQANISTLLNTSVRGHLQGAADVLHAIAEVEAQVRLTAATAATGKRRAPEIIDAEAIIIKPEEGKE